jgi:hypothetical protein
MWLNVSAAGFLRETNASDTRVQTYSTGGSYDWVLRQGLSLVFSEAHKLTECTNVTSTNGSCKEGMEHGVVVDDDGWIGTDPRTGTWYWFYSAADFQSIA